MITLDLTWKEMWTTVRYGDFSTWPNSPWSFGLQSAYYDGMHVAIFLGPYMVGWFY